MAYTVTEMSLWGILNHSHDLEGEHTHVVTPFSGFNAEHELSHQHEHGDEHKHRHDGNDHKLDAGSLEHHHHGGTHVVRLVESEYTYRRASISRLGKKVSQKVSSLPYEDWRHPLLSRPLKGRDFSLKLAVGQPINPPLLI